MALNQNSTYRVVLIKPSHYDDDGYVLQWLKTHMPANSLLCVRGIVEEAIGGKILGPGVDIIIEHYDEYSSVIPVEKIIQSTTKSPGGIVMLVGVQSSEFPRSIDLARPFREAGIPVIIGGFHVSGCVAMAPDWAPGLEAARNLDVSIFAGELEGHAGTILKDAFEGRLKPLYNVLGAPPELETAPLPHISLSAIRRTCHSVVALDLGRGCPFQCSFCAIINVQGRKSRCRSVGKVTDYIRRCATLGGFNYLISDDNFARNAKWEAFLDAFISLREKEGIKIEFFIQVDTQAARIPRFVEKAKRAGCTRVFIGMESVREDNLKDASKGQNKVEDLKEMVLAWKRAGILSYATFIIGFPHDTVKRVEEDIRFIKQNLAIDILYFFILVPLPGSEDHRLLVESGASLETDLNRYDSEHTTLDHPNMTRHELLKLYRRAWEMFYAPEHAETLFKRAEASGMQAWDIFTSFHGFFSLVKYEKIHPLQSGLLRRKHRKNRRPGLPIEPWWNFYPRRTWETITIQAKTAALGWRLWRIMKKAKREVEESGYSDAAIKDGRAETKAE